MNKEKFLLILIVAVSFFIRVYNYDYPPLLWDEAALGYNAYSILHTARDEYGQFLPLIFKSFGDYKPGLYVYLTVPFVAIFGLNSLAVRLPSIIFGSLLPLLGYFIVKKYHTSKILPLLFAFIIAFNPYNIHYSRGAWETNVLTFELLFASYLFLGKKYFWSSIIFGVTLYTYQSGKLASLLLILILILINYSKNYFKLEFIAKFVFPLFIFSLPILYGLLFQHQGNRLEVVSLFSYPRNIDEQNIIISESNQFDFQVFHNQAIFFIRNFFTRYFNHFSPQFLLTQGDWQASRHSAPYTGVLLFPSVIFLLIGTFSYLANSKKDSLSTLFILWFVLAPIPAALTRDTLQATRIMNFSVPLCYFAALGLTYFINWLIKFRYFKYIGLLILIIVYLLSFIYYADLYLDHMVKKSPTDWLYGYHQVIQYIVENGQNRTVYFTPFYGQPYIYYLFYTKYPPQKYQQQANLVDNSVDTGTVQKIDNIIFDTPDIKFTQQQKYPLVAIYPYDEIVRQAADTSKLTQISPINNISTFYGYKNP